MGILTARIVCRYMSDCIDITWRNGIDSVSSVCVWECYCGCGVVAGYVVGVCTCVVIWPDIGDSCMMNCVLCGSIQVTVFEMVSRYVGVYGCGYGVWG